MDDNLSLHRESLAIRLGDAIEKGRMAAIKIARQTNTNLIVWDHGGKVSEISPDDYLAELAAGHK